MPKYIIYRNYGWVGTDDSDIIEADTLKEAEELAWEFALDRVESWAELVEGTEDD